MHYSLSLILQHKCSFFNVNFSVHKHDIYDLLKMIEPYIDTLRTNCTHCPLHSDYITVAECTYLIVLNKENQLTTAVDLSVYSNNQQLRLYDCIKINKMNPLRPSIIFPFNDDTDNSYFTLLRKSLITYTETIHTSIIVLEKNQFSNTFSQERNSTPMLINNSINLDIPNDHYNNYFISKSKSINPSKMIKSNYAIQAHAQISLNSSDQRIQRCILFVTKTITSDSLHQGYIRSSVRGNRNTDILFFNIGGDYRYCPQKGGHHQRNTVAILIDTNNLTYTIRCKDFHCDNTNLLWKSID